LKRYVAAGILIIASLAFGLVLSEVVLRLVFDPVDYLYPYLIDDEILGHKILPQSGGHDAWGFRNRTVPERANIVAIGDSLTYGVSASAANSWPAILQGLTGKTIYNMSLGGYGPVQYDYLLENKAVSMNPSAVIVGFYYGNDVMDSYLAAYKNDTWKHLRKADMKPPEPQPIVYGNPIFLSDLRSFLAHHSVLYSSSMLSFGEILRYVEMKYNPAVDVTIYEDPERGVRTGFTPGTRLLALNLDDPNVREGLRISQEMFLRMKQWCDAKGITFRVILLPTKERVFSEFIGNDSRFLAQKEMPELLMNEGQVNDQMKRYFDENGVTYIDVLKPLSEALGEKAIYPSNQDGHPNKNGYEVIAKTVMAQMQLN
jgi:hypothetical protein